MRGRHTRAVSRFEKVLRRVLSGFADQAIQYEELCSLLLRLRFQERQHRGSHRVFFRDGVEEIINLQPRPDGTAKPYQVRQVGVIIIKYGFGSPGSADQADAP